MDKVEAIMDKVHPMQTPDESPPTPRLRPNTEPPLIPKGAEGEQSEEAPKREPKERESEESENLDKSVNGSSDDYGDESDDEWHSADSEVAIETPEYVDDRTPLQIVQEQVGLNWKNREETSRYSRVTVLLISWEDHDLGNLIDDAQYQFQKTFECLYKYLVWKFQIPKKKPNQALTTKLLELAERDDPDALLIVWYDGHGSEHKDQRGSPIWHSHSSTSTSPTVDSTVVSTALADCEADILLVNNACSSLTCSRFSGTGIVESISASAFDTATYGSPRPDDMSLSMSWAALRILRDRKTVEEGITVTELHRQICLAVQCPGRNHPDVDEEDLDAPIFWNNVHTRTQPVYTRLSAEEAGVHGRTQSIVLRRLKPADDSDTSMPYPYRPDLQLRLLVDSLDEMDPKQWTDWILSAPSGARAAYLEKPGDEKENTW